MLVRRSERWLRRAFDVRVSRACLSTLTAFNNSELEGDGHDGASSIKYSVNDDPFRTLGKTLLQQSRIPYRHIEPISEAVKKGKNEITAFRTNSQINRCIESWAEMEKKNAQIAFKTRKLGWRRNAPDKLKPNLLYGPTETIAYAQYHMPTVFGVTRRVMRELAQMMPGFQPTRMLDFGCGPATALGAAVDVWGSATASGAQEEQSKGGGRVGGGVHKYYGVDMSQAMLDAAKLMAGQFKVNSVFWDKIGDVVRLATTKGERFDLIVISYTLADMQSDPAKEAVTQLLFELLDVGGVLLILEKGHPEGSHAVRTARQFILSSFNENYDNQVHVSKLSSFQAAATSAATNAKPSPPPPSPSASSKARKLGSGFPIRFTIPAPLRPPPVGSNRRGGSHGKNNYDYTDLGASVIAPCTHDRPCPLGDGLWCSFSQKVCAAYSLCVSSGSM